MSNLATWIVVHTQTAFGRLRDRQEGQTMAEYALILGLIAIFVILALVFLRDQISDLFERTGSSVQNAPNQTS
jgi:Flp pilus assembly pilin Flp